MGLHPRMLIWWLSSFCKPSPICSTDFICVAPTSSYSFALVMFGFNPVLNRVLGLVVENIKEYRSALKIFFIICTAVHTVLVFIQCVFQCVCVWVCECACAKNKKTPFQSKKTKKGSTMNSLRPWSDSNPDPCTYFTLNYVHRPLYQCAILSVSEMDRPYWLFNEGEFTHS